VGKQDCPRQLVLVMALCMVGDQGVCQALACLGIVVYNPAAAIAVFVSYR